MALHPDLHAFLELANQPVPGRPPLRFMSAQEARTIYNDTTAALDLPGEELPVETVHLPLRDGASIGARLYRGFPLDAGLAPLLLFFHGGGYVLGSLDSHDSLCRSLASGAACNVLSVDYRLAPERRFPTAFHDAEDALTWLRDHGTGLGLNMDRLAIGGDSVGGTLATALCIAERDKASAPMPLLQLLLYPCTAAVQNTASHERFAIGYLLERDNLQWMFSQYLRDDKDRYDWRFAPLEAANLQGLPPAHIVLAEYDPLVDEGRLYAARLEAAGVAVRLEVYPGMLHDFARMGCIIEETDTLRSDVSSVLRQTFS